MGAEQSSLGDVKSLISSDNSQLKSSRVNFFINGKEFSILNDDVSPDYMLVDFIRDKAGLKGTKYMCREGGCGACVVVAKRRHPGFGVDKTRSINSCLTPVLSCDGWDITTVEKLGNKRNGYHPIQQKLTKLGGSQCGMCTPGFVMNMYGLLQSEKRLKVKDIEDSMDGNVCRCTGYRPILDAFKSFADDAPEELKRKCADIEDCCAGCPMVTTNGKGEGFSQSDEFTCCSLGEVSKIELKLKSGEEWHKPTTLEELFESLEKFQASGIRYRLVAGNTSTGIYKNDTEGVQAFIDISGLSDLSKYSIDPALNSVTLGSLTTLSDAIELYRKGAELRGYEYCGQLSTHLKRVANVPVRNLGTLGGNLMIKHTHNEFPSDIFTLHEAIGALVIVQSAINILDKYTLEEFLKVDMKGKVLMGVEYPKMTASSTEEALENLKLTASSAYSLNSYKITQRYQNTHAYVNGAILMKVDQKDNFKVVEKPRIVFGGIKHDFIHAKATETFLEGKHLNDPNTIKGAMDSLEEEVKPDHVLPDASPEYRKKLTQSLLYKAILSILGKNAGAKVQSGGTEMERLVTKGKQTYDTDQKSWPLNQPVQKIEGPSQASGEAEFINDIIKQNGELFGAFVLSTTANAEIANIDAGEALQIPGVVEFITAKDIPGENDSQGVIAPGFPAQPEEIFASSKIEFAGQPIGLILAEDRNTAFKAVKMVKVTYKNQQQPILTIADWEKAHKKEIFKPNAPSKNRVSGEMNVGSQYHFHMETHTTLAVPGEDDSMDIYPATQATELVHRRIAKTLNWPNNKINIQVRRIGGAYGGKTTKSNKVACAAAVGCYVTRRPVRIVLDLESNMRMIGKRLPYKITYDVGHDDWGTITDLKVKMIADSGYTINESNVFAAKMALQNVYAANDKWEITPETAVTHTPPNTFTRAPGTVKAIAAIENIMDHIAQNTGKDQLEVRANNFFHSGQSILFNSQGEKEPKIFAGENPIPKMLGDLKASSDYMARKKFIETFNANNRWKKRGMSMIPIKYGIHWISGLNKNFQCMVVIHSGDGSVSIKHSGVEMGQGINTKAAQVVAWKLGVPLENIKVKPLDSFVNANACPSGGSVASELVCLAATNACDILLKRLLPFREKMGPETPFSTLVSVAFLAGMDLTANYRVPSDDPVKTYDVWAINLTEVEIDILTGEYKVVRLDLIEDAGKSLSPKVDIGQIEGCVAFGIGLWTTEKIVRDPNTGEMLTNNTWNYKVPFPKDIPEDMRITLLKDAPNPHGVLNSKATGEPAMDAAVAVLFAIRNALFSARKDVLGKDEFFNIDGPATPEDVFKYTLTDKSQFTL